MKIEGNFRIAASRFVLGAVCLFLTRGLCAQSVNTSAPPSANHLGLNGTRADYSGYGAGGEEQAPSGKPTAAVVVARDSRAGPLNTVAAGFKGTDAAKNRVGTPRGAATDEGVEGRTEYVVTGDCAKEVRAGKDFECSGPDRNHLICRGGIRLSYSASCATWRVRGGPDLRLK